MNSTRLPVDSTKDLFPVILLNSWQLLTPVFSAISLCYTISGLYE